MDTTRKYRRNGEKEKLDLSTLVYGKVPPNSRELEETVLGAIMLERDAYDKICDILRPESFYRDEHQKIFRAVQSLAVKSQPIDTETVSEQLQVSEELDAVGGRYYIIKLTNHVVSSANLEAHASIIQKKYLKREQIRIYAEGLSAAYEDSTDGIDLLDQTSAQLNGISMNFSASSGMDISEALVRRVQYMEDMKGRTGELIGVPTGFPILDRVTKGWIDGNLIIFAARPSVGKTALALNLTDAASSDPVNPTAVLYNSLEMSAGELTDRLLSAKSAIPYEEIKKAKLSEERMRQVFVRGIQPLSRQRIFIDDHFSLNILELRAKARRWVKTWRGRPAENGKPKCEKGLIIVDYLQLMSGAGEDMTEKTRDRVISNITKGLKSLAKELQVPIIALSQMSREIERRDNKNPKLSDLRDSGGIEQDADIVAFLAREDYEQADFEINEDSRDKGSITFRKHRGGALERIPMRTAMDIQRWMTWDQYDTYQRNKVTLRDLADAGRPSLFPAPIDHSENDYGENPF